MRLDRRAEWKQIFNESWRQMRDFFYAPNMHGVDWPAMREKYAALLPHVNHRADLTYVIGEMIARAEHRPRLRRRRRAPGSRRASSSACSAPSFHATRRRRSTKIDKILPGENWSTARSLAAHRDRRQRQGGRLHPRRQRPAGRQAGEPLRRAHRHGRQAGRAEGELQAGGRRLAGGRRHSHRRRGGALLQRLGAGQHRQRLEEDRRQGRLRPHPRHGPAGPERIRASTSIRRSARRR